MNSGDKLFTVPADRQFAGVRKSYPRPRHHPHTLRAMKNTPRTAASIAVTPLSQAKGPPRNRGVRQPLHDVQRREELARLLPLWPKELEDLSIAGRRHIIHTLNRALRAERRRGRAGH